MACDRDRNGREAGSLCVRGKKKIRRRLLLDAYDYYSSS